MGNVAISEVNEDYVNIDISNRPSTYFALLANCTALSHILPLDRLSQVRSVFEKWKQLSFPVFLNKNHLCKLLPQL